MAKKKKVSKKKVSASIDEFRQKFEALDNKRTKHTSQAIERRRQDVWEMMCQDIPQTEMAGLLSVARSTIALDVKFWKSKLAARVSRMKNNPDYADIELGMTVRKLDSVTALAFEQFSMAKSNGEKAKFLDIITKTLSTKTRIMQETGYLPKAGIEIRAKVERLSTFSERFGEESPLSALDNANSRHRLLGLAERIVKLSREEDANTIDATGVVGVTRDAVAGDPVSGPSAADEDN
jgi:hypothetical protein